MLVLQQTRWVCLRTMGDDSTERDSLHVHLRTLTLPETGSHDITRLSCDLSPEEREKAGRFRFERDSWSYAASHALLRRMLEERTGLPASQWCFTSNAYGRPEIDAVAHPGIDILFNISHTHGLAVCAMLDTGGVPDVKLGVDAESLGRKISERALAPAVLTPDEAALLLGLSAEQARHSFLSLWTMKEAVLKAVGIGFGYDPKRISCSLDPLSVTSEDSTIGAPRDWHLAQHTLDSGHVLSIAVRRPLRIKVVLDNYE